ncbi:MAG: type II toxin-antitoxin system VapC family toxin [Bryobacteraceae bacterium]|jgi:predicted nucleic acid-binding protein
MTTAIDSNVIIALWDKDPALSQAAQAALEAAQSRGPLVIAAPVYAELMAAPGRDETFLDAFLTDTGVTVEWELGPVTWRLAGRAFQAYAARRRKHPEAGPRCILADFLIGAHALRAGYRLLTLDARIYRSAFPSLTLIAI